MRFVIACPFVVLALAVAASPAAAQGAQPATPQGAQPNVPPGYEGAPGQGQPAGQPPPPPTGWGQPPPPGLGATYPPSTEPPAPEPEGPIHDVSITLSPFHLILPVVEVMGEFRLGDRVGLAAILGGGAITGTGALADETFTVFELGSQFLFYPVGDFDHGMQLGLEALYIYVSGETDAGVTGTGSGISVGPLLGYKLAASFGLTIDLQGGVALAGIAATATDGTTTEEDGDVQLIPLLNLNAGWSF